MEGFPYHSAAHSKILSAWMCAMAPRIWEIKPVKDKGVGVFATQHIKPGTIIMDDQPALTVPFPASEATIAQAFQNLDKDTQDKLLQLHEGAECRGTKTMRICRANGFGNPDGLTASIYLNVSRVNHSCAPNAFMCADDTESAQCSKQLIACKEINTGEEICITYSLRYEIMPAHLRTILTRARYGFVCSCRCCALPACQLQLSDARRLPSAP